jgi:hypothetical protein
VAAVAVNTAVAAVAADVANAINRF